MLTIFLCLRHPPDMFEWTIAVREDGQRTLTIFGGKEGHDSLRHAKKDPL